jgi:hypothetical protein
MLVACGPLSPAFSEKITTLAQITVKCMICLGKWFSKLYAARTAVQIAGMVTGFPASFSRLN